MSYKTVLTTPAYNQVILLKSIFEQHKINYRFLDESTNTNFPVGVRVQVEEKDVKRAEALLRENGFLEAPGTGENSFSMGQFWIWLVIALFAIIVISIIISI